MLCPSLVKTGKRKGLECGVKLKPGFAACGMHTTKIITEVKPAVVAPAITEPIIIQPEPVLIKFNEPKQDEEPHPSEDNYLIKVEDDGPNVGLSPAVVILQEFETKKEVSFDKVNHVKEIPSNETIKENENYEDETEEMTDDYEEDDEEDDEESPSFSASDFMFLPKPVFSRIHFPPKKIPATSAKVIKNLETGVNCVFI